MTNEQPLDHGYYYDNRGEYPEYEDRGNEP